MLSPSSASTGADDIRQRQGLHRHAIEEEDGGRRSNPVTRQKRPLYLDVCQRSSPERRGACLRGRRYGLKHRSSISCSVGQIRANRPGRRPPHQAVRSRSSVTDPAARGDDERGRREIVGAHLLLDAPLEVAVAAQHRRHDQLASLDLRRHLVGQRTAVPDARRTAVANEIEPEPIEIQVETGFLEVVGNDLRPGRQAGLHPGLGDEPLLDGLSRDEPAPISTLGFDVLVQLVMAAITTEP
jgi:hypothetical protein